MTRSAASHARSDVGTNNKHQAGAKPGVRSSDGRETKSRPSARLISLYSAQLNSTRANLFLIIQTTHPHVNQQLRFAPRAALRVRFCARPRLRPGLSRRAANDAAALLQAGAAHLQWG